MAELPRWFGEGNVLLGLYLGVAGVVSLATGHARGAAPVALGLLLLIGGVSALVHSDPGRQRQGVPAWVWRVEAGFCLVLIYRCVRDLVTDHAAAGIYQLYFAVAVAALCLVHRRRGQRGRQDAAAPT